MNATNIEVQDYKTVSKTATRIFQPRNMSLQTQEGGSFRDRCFLEGFISRFYDVTSSVLITLSRQSLLVHP